MNIANKWGITASMKASWAENNAKCFDLLIKAGADVNAVNKFGQT